MLLAAALSDAEKVANGPAIQVRCLECGFAETPSAPARLKLTPALLALIAK
jgi:protease-4